MREVLLKIQRIEMPEVLGGNVNLAPEERAHGRIPHVQGMASDRLIPVPGQQTIHDLQTTARGPAPKSTRPKMLKDQALRFRGFNG